MYMHAYYMQCPLIIINFIKRFVYVERLRGTEEKSEGDQ